MARVEALRPNGTAAEARREDFTKPRREICLIITPSIAVKGEIVKEGTRAGSADALKSALIFRPFRRSPRKTPRPFGTQISQIPNKADVFDASALQNPRIYSAPIPFLWK